MNQFFINFTLIILCFCSIMSGCDVNDVCCNEDKYIYKIFTKKQWEKIQENRSKFNSDYGTEKDKEDGFLHFSTTNQIEVVANKFFKDLKNGYLVEVDCSTIKEKLRWEKNSKGQLFPHIYGEISKESIKNVYKDFSTESFDFNVLK